MAEHSAISLDSSSSLSHLLSRRTYYIIYQIIHTKDNGGNYVFFSKNCSFLSFIL
jgi:hypothetical protein